MKSFTMIKNILLFITCLAHSSIHAQVIDSYDNDQGPLPGNKVTSVVIDTAGIKWFGTDSGLVAYDGSSWNIFTTSDNLASNNINDLAFEISAYGPELWIATDNGVSVMGIPAVDAVTGATPYRTSNTDLISDNVYCVSVDTAEHERWFGTEGGISVFKNNTWYDTAYGLITGDKITTIGISPVDGWRYITLEGSGVSRLKFNEVDGFTGASTYEMPWSYGLLSDTVYSSHIQSDGFQWFGSSAGVCLHEDSAAKLNWTPYAASDSLVGAPVLSIAQTQTGNIWFGTIKGASFFNFKKTQWTNITKSDGLIGDTVYDIAIDPNNNVWFATNNGVSFYNAGNLEIENTLSNDHIINIYPNPFKLPGELTINTSTLNSPIITIHSILGKLVYHQKFYQKNITVWDGTGLTGNPVTSGIFIVRIQIENNIYTRKILVIN